MEAVIGAARTIFLLWVIVKITRRIRPKKPWSEKEVHQHNINRSAPGTDEEKLHALGKSAQDAKKKGGLAGFLLLLAILFVVFLLLTASH